MKATDHELTTADNLMQPAIVMSNSCEAEDTLRIGVARHVSSDANPQDTISQAVSEIVSSCVIDLRREYADIISRIEKIWELLKVVDGKLVANELASSIAGSETFDSLPRLVGESRQTSVKGRDVPPFLAATGVDKPRHASTAPAGFQDRIPSTSSCLSVPGTVKDAAKIRIPTSHFVVKSDCSPDDDFGDFGVDNEAEGPAHSERETTPVRERSLETIWRSSRRRSNASVISGASIFASFSVARKNVYNLDAMHTDRLLEAQGFKSRRQSLSSTISNNSPSPSDFRTSLNSAVHVQATKSNSKSKSKVATLDNIAECAERIRNSEEVPVSQPEALNMDEPPLDSNIRSTTVSGDECDFSMSYQLSMHNNYSDGETRSLHSFDDGTVSQATAMVLRSRNVKNSRYSHRSLGMDGLRAEHEANLLYNSADNEKIELGEDNFAFGWPGWVLAMCGVIPFMCGISGWCLVCVILLSLLLALAYSVIMVFCEMDDAYLHLSTAFYTIGGISGLLFLRIRQVERLLGPYDNPLERYAKDFGYLGEWRIVSMARIPSIVLLWSIMVASRVALFTSADCPAAVGGDRNGGLCGLAAFILVSGLLFALTFCQLHVCCGLEMSVDQYCFRFFDHLDIAKGIDEWNLLQALLRRYAANLDSCFLSCSTSVLGTLLLTFQRSGGFQGRAVSPSCGILWCGWLYPPVLLFLLVFFKSAAVTEKCSRVPALVNQWAFQDNQIDTSRQYVVQYIEHSAAGFYVKGVRLSGFMALKISYLCGIVVFTLVTQSMIKGDQ